MQMLADNPSEAYRKVDLEARIEAAAGHDLARICLEEAIAALGHVLFVLERDPRAPVYNGLSRAHSIALYLARSVTPENPMRPALLQFYGGVAEVIGRNLTRPAYGEILEARDDLSDILQAVHAG